MYKMFQFSARVPFLSNFERNHKIHINNIQNTSIMSSLYIHRENQTILWNIIHKIPAVQNMNEEIKTQWFKSIIESFHTTYPTISSFEELREINRQTILFIKEQFHKKQTLEIQQNVSPLDAIPSRNLQENKEEIFSNMFSERNKEYEKMMEKKAPPPLSFEPTKDEPLKNMDELVKQQVLEREWMEKEIPSYSSGGIPDPLPPR